MANWDFDTEEADFEITMFFWNNDGVYKDFLRPGCYAAANGVNSHNKTP